MTNSSLDDQCKVTLGKGEAVKPNIDGAQILIGNYLDSYRCTMREASNGRQPWEILSFLSLVGSTTAIALGGGRNLAVLGGAGNSVFSAGNSYYAPRDQVEILDQAVDALACIQNESVGIDPFALKAVGETQQQIFGAVGISTVEIPVERQYFNMVSSSLITVERAATQRLAKRGSFNPAGTAAQIEALVKKIDEAEKAKKTPPPKSAVYATQNVAIATLLQTVQLDLAIVQGKLQKCALLAQG